ncbi:tape measure protein [Gordonia sp. SND2]|uniref:aggregation-promoting factor C-terminal-like domain-containing protein n=1 Tax=Gordonia sp. SND2 TaxID=3388659 RepID=UPI00398BBB9C
MTELATAYVSIVADTRRIAPDVKKALGQADASASAAGKSMGGKMSSALGLALKTGAATAAAAGVGAIGTAMVKGFQRLSAIDDAKGKLAGLGTTAADTAKIMDSALTAVKGTAFGLGDAATIAGNAVAAGIKPGQELTKYLSMTADAASIAGVSLSDMGSILNQVQTGQMAYTDDLNQLADRGIPIYQWLAKEAGVTGAEVKKMASDGKISSEMFFAAIQKNIGGAAQEAGKTVRGGFQNMIAALGRLGAAAEQPFFSRLPGMFAGATTAIDNMTPTVTRLAEALDQKIFDEWGPKLRDAFEAAKSSGVLDNTKDTMRGLAEAAKDAWPSLVGIGKALAQASAAAGVGTWQLFLSALQAGAGLLNTINPALETLADLMANHPALVATAVAAWAAFKTIPDTIGRVTGSVGEHFRSMIKDASGFGKSIRETYSTAANAAPGFNRTVGLSAVAMRGLKAAGTNVMNMFGGPFGAAMAGAGGVLALVMGDLQRSRQRAQEYEAAVKALGAAQGETNSVMMKARGAMTDEVYAALTKQAEAFIEVADKATESQKRISSMKMLPPDAQMANQVIPTLSETLDHLKISSEDVGKAVAGSGAEWSTFIGRLKAAGVPPEALADLEKMRSEFERQRDLARTVTPGVSELSSAMQVLGDKASTAAEKSKALSAALEALNPARSKGDALARHAETMDRITESTQQAIDNTKGFGESLLNSETAISTSSENGRELRQSILDIVDASKAAAENGTYTADVQRQNAEAYAALATKYGLTTDQIKNAADQLGADDLDLIMRLSVEDDATQKLGAISIAWQAVPEQKSITVAADQITDETRQKLTDMGIQVSQPMDGKVTITANDEDARRKILEFTKQFQGLNGLRSIPNLDLNNLQFLTKDGDARARLNELSATTADPKVSAVIDDLLAGHKVSMERLAELDSTTAKPLVDLLAEKAKQDADDVKNRIDGIKDKDVTIRVHTQAEQTEYGQAVIAALQQSAQDQGFSSGGWTGPGSKYQPAGIVHADEFVIRKESRKKIEAAHPGALDSMNATGQMPGYADGGRVASAADLKRMIQPLAGRSYGWGAWPTWDTDCSGAQSIGRNLALTGEPFGGGRFATGNEQESLLASGYQLGRAPAGVPAVEHGLINGGPGGGHTAGTIIDPQGSDLNFEMGGAGGNGQVGGTAAGSRDGQFSHIAWLPLSGSASKTDQDLQYADGNGADQNYQSGQQQYDSTSSSSSSRTTGGVKGIFQKWASDMAGIAYGGIWQFLGIDEPWWLQVDGPEPVDKATKDQVKRKLTDAEKQQLKAEKAEKKAEFERQQLEAKQAHESALQELKNDQRAGRIEKADYERQVQELKSKYEADGVSRKQSYESALADIDRKYGQTPKASSDLAGRKQQLKSDFEADKLKAKQEHDAEVERVRGEYKGKQSKEREAERDRRLKALQSEFETKQLKRKQEYDRAVAGLKDSPSTPRSGQPSVDRSVTKPGKGQDLGVSGTGSDVKSLFKQGLREAWRQGPEWDASDYIVNKESSWDPKARNPESGAFGLGQWLGSTKDQYLPDESTDPTVQGKAFDGYVGDRYGLPTKAKEFWDAHNWYDQGGEANGIGLMLKNTIKPERVLSPSQTEAFEQGMRNGFAGDTANLEAKLDQLIDVMSRQPAGGTTNVTVADQAGFFREKKTRDLMAAIQYGGGR